MKASNETPCKECENRVGCNKMCLDRLLWAIFEGGEDIGTYGDDREVGSNREICFALDN